VEDALPHLIEPIESGSTPTLQYLVKASRRRLKDQCPHARKCIRAHDSARGLRTFEHRATMAGWDVS
jgi:hypothetical protein